MASTYVSVVGPNTKEGSGSVSMVASNQKQFPHSRGCVRTRVPGTSCFLFSTKRTQAGEIDDPAYRRVPRLPEQQSKQHQHTAVMHGEYVEIPQVRWPLCPSVVVAGHLGEPLSAAPSTKHPLPALLSFTHVECQHRFEP